MRETFKKLLPGLSHQRSVATCLSHYLEQRKFIYFSSKDFVHRLTPYKLLKLQDSAKTTFFSASLLKKTCTCVLIAYLPHFTASL